ncbi:MAG: ABC transporter permease [Alphaproteobacteria bacterium]|nr:ABC transporter permease [Alphaproteobacteria bacterium]
MNPALRALIVFGGILLLWQGIVIATDAPHFILPAPLRVFRTLLESWPIIQGHALVTGAEILLGLLLGTLLGMGSALAMTALPPLRRWMLPLLVISQAMPVFALAPLLALWLGFGLASKVAMATLIIYFPVTTAFYDGLRRTDPGWLDLARSMNARPYLLLWRLRLPAALPALASGLRVAAGVAPIGAVVGEWVGAAEGLGYLMLHANGRSQTDLMFAALFTLGAMAVALWFALDAALRRLIPWQPDTLTARS